LAFGGRPVDIGLSPDQHVLFIKNTESVTVLDATHWQLIQNLAYPQGEAGSMHGPDVSRDGAASLFQQGEVPCRRCTWFCRPLEADLRQSLVNRIEGLLSEVCDFE